MKYYAIKNGRTIGILTSWLETEESIKGFKGAIYKSFTNKEDAENYLNIKSKTVLMTEFSEDDLSGIHVWTDGSYSNKSGRTGYGIVIVKDGEVIDKISDECFSNSSRNITGEVVAVLKALKICKQKGYNTITIHYDYIGIGCWIFGEWEAKGDVSQNYIRKYKEFVEGMNCTLIKTKGHEDDRFNEIADELAKAGIGLI